MMVSEFTSVRLRKSTRDALRVWAEKREPLDEAVRRLLALAKGVELVEV